MASLLAGVGQLSKLAKLSWLVHEVMNTETVWDTASLLRAGLNE